MVTSEELWTTVFLLLCVLVYIVPALLAYRREHSRRVAITAVNLLLGWTFVGWVVAFVWAVIPEDAPSEPRS